MFIWLYRKKKHTVQGQTHRKAVRNVFAQERIFSRETTKTCFCLHLPPIYSAAEFTLPGQEQSAQSIQVQLNAFCKLWSPKEHRRDTATAPFSPGCLGQDMLLLQGFRDIPFLSLHGAKTVA